MKRKLPCFEYTCFAFPLKAHIVLCVFSLFNFFIFILINRVILTVLIACLYFLSGLLLNKKETPASALLIISFIAPLLGILDFIFTYVFYSHNGKLGSIAEFLFTGFCDPLQILSIYQPALELVPLLLLLQPFLLITLMLLGKKALKGFDKFDKYIDLGIKMPVIRKILFTAFAIPIIVNCYLINFPRLSIEYDYTGSFIFIKETIYINESGRYNYSTLNFPPDVSKETELKLTQKELQRLAFNLIYKNLFFKLKTDLSRNNCMDAPTQKLKIKWFGKEREVGGYNVQNVFLRNIVSKLEGKYEDYFSNNFKYGYIDRNDILRIEPKYNYAANFSGSYASVIIDESKYLIDRTGKIVARGAIDIIKTATSDLKAKMENGKYGFIDNDGKFIIQPKYQGAQDFSEGLAAVSDDNNELFYINNKDEKVFSIDPANFPFGARGGSISIWQLSKFKNGLARIICNSKYGYIDKQGNFVINALFDYANDFSEGLACVCVNEKWGYIDNTGKYVIEPVFDAATSFSEGLGCVGIREWENIRWGYIDKLGRFIIEPKYIRASLFSEGLACVMVDLAHGEVGQDNKYSQEVMNEIDRDASQ